MELSCLGYYDKSSDKCGKCEYRDAYCIDSTEINRDVFNIGSEVNEEITPEKKQTFYDDTRFSSGTAVHLIRALLKTKSDNARAMILAKMEDPSVSLSELAKRHGVSKQAVHKVLKHISDEFPEITDIVHNNKKYNKWRGKNGKRSFKNKS